MNNPLAKIDATRTDITSWMHRAATVEAPQRGSELFVDDRVWPHHPPSEMARITLLAATEHLELALEIVASRHLHVSADYSVVRGALVGGSTAVWLLGPDDPVERQQRALRHVWEWYRRKIQYDKAVRPLCATSERPNLDVQIAHSEQRKRQARALWRASPTLTAAQQPSDTERIGWAADFTFGAQNDQAIELKSLWNLLGGDAHALGWQLLNRLSEPLRRHSSGLGVGAATAELDLLAEPFLGSYRMVKRGWSLFDQRCTSP